MSGTGGRIGYVVSPSHMYTNRISTGYLSMQSFVKTAGRELNCEFTDYFRFDSIKIFFTLPISFKIHIVSED